MKAILNTKFSVSLVELYVVARQQASAGTPFIHTHSLLSVLEGAKTPHFEVLFLSLTTEP
jgi:hypothetical protein